MSETSADPYALAEAAAAKVRELTGTDQHDVALVMGSGWVPAAELLGETVTELPVTELPGFHAAAVEGHAGTLRSVRVGDSTRALVFLGRTHLYEGHGVEETNAIELAPGAKYRVSISFPPLTDSRTRAPPPR